MKYYIYRQFVGEIDYRLIAELQPGASDECCNFAGIKLWNAERGFMLGAFKIERDGSKYWVVSEDEQRMMDEEAANRQDDYDDEFVPHQSYYACNME